MCLVLMQPDLSTPKFKKVPEKTSSKNKKEQKNEQQQKV